MEPKNRQFQRSPRQFERNPGVQSERMQLPIYNYEQELFEFLDKGDILLV